MTVCPRDMQEMNKTDVASVEVDECPQCKGLWFEGQELREAEEQTDPDLAWLDFDLWKDIEQFRSAPATLSCPACGTSMAGIEYGATGVTVDVCPLGHGVWLDKDEFAKIIQALSEELAGTSANEYLKASLAEAGELFTGPESLPSEWRDLRGVLRLLNLRFFAEHPKLARFTSSVPVIG